MVPIRNLEDRDFPVLVEWWKASGELPPTREMMPNNTSFVLETRDGVAILAVTLYVLRDSKEFAILDNFIGNPAERGMVRRECTRRLLVHMESFARRLGIKRLFCMGGHPKLKALYADLGFHETMRDVSTFIKFTEESCPQPQS